MIKGKKFKSTAKIPDALDASLTSQISDLFERKGWPIEIDSDHNISRFNRFCLMLEGLAKDEQSLLLELSEHYLTIGFPVYINHLEIVLCKALTADGNNVFSKLYFMPLIAPEDKGKIKSGPILTYMLTGTDLLYSAILKGKERIIVNDSFTYKNQINKSNSSVLILVDDFIGTGETAVHALGDLFKQDFRNDKIIVISLVAQQEGLNRIHDLGVKAYTSIEHSKGISDNFLGEDGMMRLNIMNSIELKRRIDKGYKWGYGQSEALVTMGKTPDNTFPIFWYEKNKQIAPFPRC